MKGELLKLAGSLLLVYGADEPELARGSRTMLGWCDSALDDNAKNKRVSPGTLTTKIERKRHHTPPSRSRFVIPQKSATKKR